jgi:Glycoside Hydrolase Family 113
MNYFFPFLFSVFFLLGCVSQGQKINGVSYVASGEPTTQAQVQEVKKIHANYAAVMPFGFIRDLEHPELSFNTERQWFGERREGVQQYIEMLHENKIKVMLKPQIWIWRGEFTGYLKMATEEDWQKLEASYKEFILLYAGLAAETNTEIFCIGTELEQFTVHRPKFWEELISAVRNIYKGKLTYAANWDEYKRFPFWKQLDYIGIDGYFPVSAMKTPSVEDAQKGWQPWKAEMQEVSEKNNKPILFTEYGYRNIDFSGKEPWKSDRNEVDYNVEAQTNLYKALFAEVYPEPWFAGGFIWKWFIDHANAGGPASNQFSPQNKPVQAVIQAHFQLQK